MTKNVARASNCCEQIEHRDGVRGRRAVINRDPDFAFGGFEAVKNRAPPLAARHQRGVKQQHVGDEKRQERENDVRAAKREREREQAARETHTREVRRAPDLRYAAALPLRGRSASTAAATRLSETAAIQIPPSELATSQRGRARARSRSS